MKSNVLLSSAIVAFHAASSIAQATSNDEPLIDAGDIEAVVPTQIVSPAEATSIATVLDSFIASVTAAPQFSSVISVLATGIPITAQQDIEDDPTDFVLDIVRGSPLPAWATSLPPSVGEYIESIAEDAAAVATSDFAGLISSASAEVAALETGAVASGGYVFPSGGYVQSNSTGSIPTSGPRPTGSAVVPGSTPQPPQAFPGAATSLNGGTMTAALVVAGIGALLLF
ncbi:MAG: hypothetical protein Q9222_006786 [Ikaeria aurantiellina]